MTPVNAPETDLATDRRRGSEPPSVASSGSGGYDPRRDVTLIAIAVLVFGTLAVGVLGFGATPVLDDDDDDGTLFPLQSQDGPEEVRLDVQPNRTQLKPGETVEFAVSYGNGTAVTEARLRADGENYRLDENGRAAITFERGGEFTVRADKENTELTRYVADGTIVSVTRFDVPLAVEADAERSTAGQEVTFTIRRADAGEAVAGSLSLDGETYETNEVGSVTVPFERAGTFEATASKSSTDTEAFGEATTAVIVERRSVALSLSRDNAAPRPGESVSLTVRRGDTQKPINATVEIDGEQRLASDGEFTVSADRARRLELSVAAPDTDSETFETVTTTIRFERYEAPLALDADMTTVERGETVAFTARRTDTDEPVPATLTAGNRTEWLDWQGTGSVRFDEAGTVPVTVTRANTTTHTFPSDERTVTVLDTEYEILRFEAPETVDRADDVTAEFTVRNTGADPGTAELVYEFDGDEQATRAVALDPGGQETLSVSVPTDVEPGEYEHAVSTRDDTETAIIAIEDANDRE